MRFNITIDTLGPVEYPDIEADNEEQAIQIAMEWFAEYLPDIKVMKEE